MAKQLLSSFLLVAVVQIDLSKVPQENWRRTYDAWFRAVNELLDAYRAEFGSL